MGFEAADGLGLQVFGSDLVDRDWGFSCSGKGSRARPKARATATAHDLGPRMGGGGELMGGP